MAVDKEMEAVFKSSRAGVDPVSGNDVPIGSTPEEVRDDIPAQLSEGEYVVPADVVRYFGVKFFEDLRTTAKTGWMQMEQNGRVGGEPVAPEGMEMGQDELPFDISELQTIEAAEGTYVAGFDEGGLAGTDVAGAFSGMPSAISSKTEQRMYKDPNNPNSAAIPLIFINGEPSGQASFYIQQGYVPASGEAEETTEQAPEVTTAAPAQSDDDDGPKIDYERYEEMRREANKFDPLTATQDRYEREVRNARLEPSIVGGIAAMTPLGMIGGIGAKKLLEGRSKTKLEQLQADALKRADVAKREGDTAGFKDFTDLSKDIDAILKSKDAKKPLGIIGDILGLGDDGVEGTTGAVSGLLDGLKKSLKEATSWDDDKWKATGLSEEFSFLNGRDPNRSALWGSEQEALAGAIRSGNDSVVRHYEIINQHRAAAERYRQGLPTGNVMLSQRTMDRIDAERAQSQQGGSSDNDPPAVVNNSNTNQDTPSNNTNTGGYNPSTGETATSSMSPSTSTSFDDLMGDEDE